MAISDQIASYGDCFEVFERAHNHAIRVRFPDYKSAWHFQTRMHKARTLDRRESMRIYERHDPRWGKSSHDCLVVRNAREDEEGFFWVYVEPWDNSTKLLIEEVEDDEPSPIEEYR